MERGKQEMVVKPSKSDMFDFCGPLHLNCVDWSISEHRRSVAASLVKGVYVKERDRQKKRTKHDSLAPKWWEFFDFEIVETLEDKFDSSIFGVIFEYKPRTSNSSSSDKSIQPPPKYVVAFRGTLLKYKTMIRDCYLDAKIVLKGLDESSRYKMAFHALEDLMQKEDPRNVWLAGHSLGAAIALHTGKNMAKQGYYIETYLFNPPYASPSIEKIKNRHLRDGARLTVGIVKVGFSIALNKTKNNGSSSSQEDEHHHHDPFGTLRSWIPCLFVNPEDPICRDYSGYFEDRENSVRSLRRSALNMLVGALGRNGEAHLIPSAIVIKNMKNTMIKENGLIDAHELCQWWEQHSCWHSKLYEYQN